MNLVKNNKKSRRSNYRNLKKIKIKNTNFFFTSNQSKAIDYNNFESLSVDTVLRNLKRKSTFLDIGAHFGYYSSIIGKNIPKVKVIAIEPILENFNILKKNLNANEIKNCEIHNLATSDKKDTKAMNLAKITSRSSFYKPQFSDVRETIEVNTDTVDNIVKNKKIDFVKIDVEGHEIPTLKGMENTLKNNPKLKILIEFNPNSQISAGFDPSELLKTLKNLNFQLIAILEKPWQLTKAQNGFGPFTCDITNEIDAWTTLINPKYNINLLCIPKRKSFSVLFFNHTAGLGGSERSLLQLVEKFIEKGVRCRIVLPYEGPLSKKLEEIGAEYEIINYHWWCSEKKMNNEIIENTMFESINNLLNSKKSLDGFNPDVIFTNTLTIPWGALYSKLVNKPHLTFIREFGTLDFGFEFFYGFEESMKFINDNSDFVFTNSKATLNYFKKYIDNKKLDYSYAYIEIDKNKLKTNTRIYKRKKSLKLILTGGILPTKGQDIAAKAISSLIKKELDVELILLGPRYDQDYYEKICNYIENNNLTNSISFIDYVDNPLSYVNQADIVLMCSKSEAYGRVTIEGMALKKTIIGTNSGATKELLQNNEKVLYKPGDYNDLSNKIEYFANNKDQINKFGVSNFNFYKKYVRRGVYGSKVLKKLKLIGLNKPPVSRNILNILLTHLSKKLEGKNVEIRVLNSKLNSSIKSKEENIKDLQKTIDNNVAILNKIYTSKTWKLLNFYKKFLAFFKKK